MSLEWGVQVVRLTLFLRDPHSVSDKDWLIITGQEEAETRQAIPGGKRLSGRIPNGTLQLSAAGQRFDVVLSAVEIQADEQLAIPSVGALDETLKTFFETTRKWIDENEPNVVRAAFGTVLTCRTETRDAAYQHLKGLLKSLDVQPEKMRDLLYRVNWRVTSSVQAGLIINRLTTWSALRMIRRLIQIGGEIATGSGGDEVYAVRLEVDHNTDDANRTPFDPQKVIPIYSELIELARENAATGEVPC
ncbi:MAG: hypothetical protein ACRED5_17280 [Propylenella sp.]